MPTVTTRHRPSEFFITFVEAVIIVAGLAYVVTGSLAALIVWEWIAALYLLVGFVFSRWRSLRGRADPEGAAPWIPCPGRCR